MRYVFLINPIAGKGKGPETLTPAIHKYFEKSDADYKILLTEAPDDARIKAKAEAEIGDEVTIFACGGDGTIFETLNGLYGYENVRLGVIPCGSGNDFLKFFDNRELFLDVSAQLEGKETYIDIIKADDIYCMNICSLGMDAVVADGMTKFKNLPFVSGSMAYKLSVLKTFLGKLGVKVKVTIDDKFMGVIDSLFAVAANGTTYGGGYSASPKASPFDGKLNFLIVEKISKLKILSFLKLYEEGRHEELPCCISGTCSSMEIETEEPAPINLDGEIIHKTKVRFEVAKRGVKFVLPRGITAEYKAADATTV